MIFVRLAHAAFDWALWSSISAVVLIGLVLAAQSLLRRHLSARWRYNLWLVVVARLLLPPLASVPFHPLAQISRHEEPVASHAAWAVSNPTNSEPANANRMITSVTPSPHEQAEPPAPPDVTSVAANRRAVGIWVAPPTSSPQDAVKIEPPTLDTLTSAIRTTIGTPAPQAASTDVRHEDMPTMTAGRRHAYLHSLLTAAQPPHKTDLWRFALQKIPWRMLIVPAWLVGVLVVGFRHAWVTIRLRFLVRRLRQVKDPVVLGQLEDCCRVVGVRRAPVVLEGPEGSGPALVGAVCPLLVLPPCVLRDFAGRDLQLIFLHELTHLRRRDVMINYLCSVITAIQWFNPIVWIALARMRCDRELACDEAVLRLNTRQGPQAYGSLIVKLLERLSGGSEITGAMGVVQRKSFMQRRIVMIAHFDGTSRRWSVPAVALSLLIGGVALASSVRAEQEAAPDAAPQTSAAATPSPEKPDPQAAPDAAPGTEPVPADEPSVAEAQDNIARAAGGASSAQHDTPAPAGQPTNEPASTPPAVPADPFAASPEPGQLGSTVAPPTSAQPELPPGTPGGSADAPPTALPPATPALPGGRGTLHPPTPAATNDNYNRGVQAGMYGGPAGGRAPNLRPGGRGSAMPSYMAAGSGEAEITSVQDTAEATADDRTADKLQRPGTLSVEKQPLDRVLNSLAQQAGIDLIVDARAFEHERFSPASQVTLTLQNRQPIGQLISLVLRAAGGNELDYSILHGVVVASTRADLSREIITRAYEIGDLGNTGQLAEIILGSIAPDSAPSNAHIRMRLFGQKLLVTTTEPNQRQIRKLLEVLRERSPGNNGGSRIPGQPGSSPVTPDGAAGPVSIAPTPLPPAPGPTPSAAPVPVPDAGAPEAPVPAPDIQDSRRHPDAVLAR